MYVWVGISIALCHPSGVEQLFINKVQRAAKKCLPTFTLDHFCEAACNLDVTDSVFCAEYIFREAREAKTCC